MKTPQILVTTLILFLVAATTPSRAQGNPDEQAWRMARPVDYEVLEEGNDGSYLEPVVLVATSEKQWNEAMMDLEADRLLTVVPGPPPPDGVDWDREAVLLVALGQFSEFHCALDARELRRISFRALCDVRIRVVPGPRLQTVTSPYLVIKFSKRGGVRSAAARYEYTFAGSLQGAASVQYSDRQSFSVAPAREPEKVSWSGLKYMLSEF
jgi:hypothetical protein